jgi:hypothetical protein
MDLFSSRCVGPAALEQELRARHLLITSNPQQPSRSCRRFQRSSGGAASAKENGGYHTGEETFSVPGQAGDPGDHEKCDGDSIDAAVPIKKKTVQVQEEPVHV